MNIIIIGEIVDMQQTIMNHSTHPSKLKCECFQKGICSGEHDIGFKVVTCLSCWRTKHQIFDILKL